MKEIAETILSQLGGSNRLVAMVGAFNFFTKGDNLSFRFKGSKSCNYVNITLNSFDLYDVEFGKFWGTNYKVVKEVNGVYFDCLKSLFEETTGLYLSL